MGGATGTRFTIACRRCVDGRKDDRAHETRTPCSHLYTPSRGLTHQRPRVILRLPAGRRNAAAASQGAP